MLVTDLSERLIGLAVLVLAFVLILPIPFGNFVPALTCALFSLALMQRDGLAALAGWGMSGVTVAILAVVWKTVERAVLHMMQWVWTARGWAPAARSPARGAAHRSATAP